MRKHKARLTCFWRTSMGESWLVMVSMGTSLPARVWHSTFWLQNRDLNTTIIKSEKNFAGSESNRVRSDFLKINKLKVMILK